MLALAWVARQAAASRDDAGWERWLAKLRKYMKPEHGHCRVPQCLAEDPRLANWVVCSQRKLKKKLDRGELSALSPYNDMHADCLACR